ncbi:hypothetical protein DLM76_21135 [Leptospira yasudae]|nr:hypothetical protein DLM76_21135 [Leptospira yasudae]
MLKVISKSHHTFNKRQRTPNFVSSLRSGSLMRPSLRLRTLLCRFGLRDATKVAQALRQSLAHKRLGNATSRRLFR